MLQVAATTCPTRRAKRKEVRRLVQDVILSYKRLQSDDEKQLRMDIMALVSPARAELCIEYWDVCTALEWLYRKRRVNVGYVRDQNGRQVYAAALR